jgi:hypothetical protein
VKREAPTNTDRRAWFRLYPADMRSVEIEALSDEEFRCLFRLWCYACEHGGLIPNDDDELRQIGKKQKRSWEKLRFNVLAMWSESPNNPDFLTSSILQRDAAEYAAKCEKLRASARKGGEMTRRRWEGQMASQMALDGPSALKANWPSNTRRNRSSSSKEEEERGASSQSAPLLEIQKQNPKPAFREMRDHDEACR